MNVKKISSILCSLIVLLTYNIDKESVRASTTSQHEYDYVQNFDGLSSLPEGWYLPTANPSGSSVYIQNDALYIDSLEVIQPAAVYYDAPYDNYVIEMDFTVEELLDNNRWFGTCFRVQETNGWYKGSVGFGSSYAINKYSKTNISGGAYTEYLKGSFIYPPQLNQTYTIKITCFNEKVSFELDGEYIIHGELPQDFLIGNVGACCSGAKVKIDNVKIKEATEPGIEVTHTIANIHIPETEIVNPPIVVSPYDTESVNKAAVSIIYVDDNANALNEHNEVIGSLLEATQNIKSTSIPAFYIENETQANHIISYLKSTNLLESFVIANSKNAELLEKVKETCYYTVGIVDYTDDKESIKNSKKDVVLKMNRLGVNVLLLPNDVSKEDVFYFQRRMLTIWTNPNSSNEIYSSLTAGVNGILYNSSDEVYEIYKSFTNTTVIREPIVMAHRGVSKLYPQNTLKGYQLAYEMGAKAIEIDVNITADNQIVLFHDSTLDNLTNGTGKITSKTLAELNNISVDIFASSGIYEKIPTLDSVFKYFSDKDMIFMLDMKGGAAAVPSLKELIDKYDMAANCLIMSSNQTTILKAKELLPEVVCCRGGFSDVINNLEHDKSIEAGIKTLAPYSLQPFPYWYNADGTWKYMYEMSARGWLTYASTTNGQVNVDERGLFLYGATSILSDDFQLTRDYIYSVIGENFEVNVNQEFELKCYVEGFDGTYLEKCKFYLLSDGEYQENNGKYVFNQTGSYTIIPVYEVTLKREVCRDVKYEVFGKPITITVK